MHFLQWTSLILDLDWVCLTTTHALQDIYFVYPKESNQTMAHHSTGQNSTFVSVDVPPPVCIFFFLSLPRPWHRRPLWWQLLVRKEACCGLRNHTLSCRVFALCLGAGSLWFWCADAEGNSRLSWSLLSGVPVTALVKLMIPRLVPVVRLDWICLTTTTHVLQDILAVLRK